MTVPEVITKINNKEPFAFSRWGDGEWICMRGSKGANTDGNTYYRDLGDRLKEIVSKKQDYIMGCQFTTKLISDKDTYQQDWKNANVFHHASIKNKLLPFIECLKNAYVVYVGNESLKKLPFVNKFIEIPYNNVWDEYGAHLTNIQAIASASKPMVFLFSAGMAANVFIHDLWTKNPNQTYIDIGSVFDPYVGRFTRTYHYSLKTKELCDTQK